MLPLSVLADTPDTTQLASIDNHYSGGYMDAFPQELSVIQTYVTAAQSGVASKIGLQFGQGFHHPVMIRFEDGAPRINENPYFYIRTQGMGEAFRQDLVVNVEAYAKPTSISEHNFSNLRSSFWYGMSQLMLNDLAAGDPDKALPTWLQEGLSVYASGSGEALLKEVVRRMPKSRVKELTGGLNSPDPYLTPDELARYFLAVDFIASKGVLQTFVTNMIREPSAADAVRGAFGYDWPDFETNVQNYSIQQLAGYAPTDEELKNHPVQP